MSEQYNLAKIEAGEIRLYLDFGFGVGWAPSGSAAFWTRSHGVQVQANSVPHGWMAEMMPPDMQRGKDTPIPINGEIAPNRRYLNRHPQVAVTATYLPMQVSAPNAT